MAVKTSMTLGAVALTLAVAVWLLPLLALGSAFIVGWAAVILLILASVASPACALVSTGFAIAALRQQGAARGLGIAALLMNFVFAGAAAWIAVDPNATLLPTETRPMK